MKNVPSGLRPDALRVARRAANQTGEIYHVYPVQAPEGHVLEITEETLKLYDGALCPCGPAVEDYAEEGGGTVVIHNWINWN